MTRYQSAAEAAGRTAEEQEQRQRKRSRTAAERKQRREERSRTAAARARPRRSREPPARPARQPARPRLRQRSRRPPPRPRPSQPRQPLRDLREHLHHRSPPGSPAAPAQRLRQQEQPARQSRRDGRKKRGGGEDRTRNRPPHCISSSPPRLLRAIHALHGLDDRSSAAETRKRPEKQFCTLRESGTRRPRVDIRPFFHAPETRGASTFWPATSQKNFGSVPSSPHHPLFQPSRRSSPFSYSQSQSTAKRSSTK